MQHLQPSHMYFHIIGYTYIAQTVPMSLKLFLPLNEVLSLHFLPAVTGQPALGSTEHYTISLPVHHGHHSHCSFLLFLFNPKLCCGLFSWPSIETKYILLSVYHCKYQGKLELRLSRSNDLYAQADLLLSICLHNCNVYLKQFQSKMHHVG